MTYFNIKDVCRPTASEDVWARYIQVHPEAAKYKTKTLQYFDELDVIFGGSCATGVYAMSSTMTPVSSSATASSSANVSSSATSVTDSNVSSGEDVLKKNWSSI